MPTTTAVIFGNQLYANHPALEGADRVLMVETLAKWQQRPYHAQKITFVVSAMRHYADELRAQGYTVDYRHAASFGQAVRDHVAEFGVTQLVLIEPLEYHAAQAIHRWKAAPLTVLPDDKGFTCTYQAFIEWSRSQKSLLLERFYRWQRTRLNVLMDGSKPVGGRWNFDAENRQGATATLSAPPLPWVEPDAITRDVMETVRRELPNAFGELDNFRYPVTRAEADHWLDRFITERLPEFGPWQDAMHAENPFLYHGVLAMLLNIGLLDPHDVAERAETAFRAGKVPLQSVEGFLRQIIGWREYVNGVYWLKMPEYAQRNFFEHSAPLPDFFWTGDTDMQCLRESLADLKRYAYTHHIPRLMLFANFGNLAGIDPAALTEWFQTTYIDAYDWVMQPNVLGLGLYADGGFMATKPYVASATYIGKMSHGYCNRCRYNAKTRTGDDACPFNVLYWDFLYRHRERLRGNPRMSIMLKSADQRPDMPQIQAQAAKLRARWGIQE